MRRFVIIGCTVLATFTYWPFIALGQSATGGSASDPQAVALATQALAALGSAQVNDVTLAGSVTRSVGPDAETGSFTLKAAGLAQSRMDLTLPSGTITEIRTITNGVPAGVWQANGNAVHQIPNHNLASGAVWFFPLSMLSNRIQNPNSIITYVGLETRNGRSVQHLHVVVQPPQGDSTGMAEHLTGQDFYLDSSTLLLVSLTYSEHPDNNAIVDIPVELDFSDYRIVSGIELPFRIQKTFSGSLLLDITVQSAALNSGLTNSDFTVQ